MAKASAEAFDLVRWMDEHNRDAGQLAKELNISRRTVVRWRAQGTPLVGQLAIASLE